MARKPMVTRTITTTKVNALCMDIVACEPINKEFVLPRTYKDNKALMKALEVHNTDTLKIVHVVDKTEVETCYGMSESDFIANATVLDPTTRKALEDEESADEE